MKHIDIPALVITQSPGREIYSFGIDGKVVPDFALVSRAHRNGGDISLIGYQRPEVRRHVAEIRAYLESDKPMIPNSIVLAFNKEVTFIEGDSQQHGPSRVGVLRIPTGGADKVGFVVDGQQRLAAIRESNLESFPIFAVAFIAASDAEQRAQFLLVNATKPLPRGLIHELLPGVEGRLPSRLQKRKLPAELVAHLNYREDSPLYGVIKTATNPGGRMADTSMLKVIQASLSDGILWEIAHVEKDDAVEHMYQVMAGFWRAVKSIWEDVWELKPKKSRLLHGAGVASLGYLMEEIAGKRTASGWPTTEFFEEELALVAPHCHWTNGWWDFGDERRRRWDELQNVTSDILMLTSHLRRLYRGLRGSEGP